MLYSITCSDGEMAGFSAAGVFRGIGCVYPDGSPSGGIPSMQPVSLQPESIDAQTNFTDGATLGWGVAAAMAAAWAVVHLRKALFR